MAAAEQETTMDSQLTIDVSLPGVNDSDLERELQHFDDDESDSIFFAEDPGKEQTRPFFEKRAKTKYSDTALDVSDESDDGLEKDDDKFDKVTDDKAGGKEKNSDTLSCGRWSAEEHDRFLKGEKIFGRQWSKLAQHVGTRSVSQVRSHAQKYEKKVRKQRQAQKRLNQHTAWLKQSKMHLANLGIGAKAGVAQAQVSNQWQTVDVNEQGWQITQTGAYPAQYQGPSDPAQLQWPSYPNGKTHSQPGMTLYPPTPYGQPQVAPPGYMPPGGTQISPPGVLPGYPGFAPPPQAQRGQPDGEGEDNYYAGVGAGAGAAPNGVAQGMPPGVDLGQWYAQQEYHHQLKRWYEQQGQGQHVPGTMPPYNVPPPPQFAMGVAPPLGAPPPGAPPAFGTSDRPVVVHKHYYHHHHDKDAYGQPTVGPEFVPNQAGEQGGSSAVVIEIGEGAERAIGAAPEVYNPQGYPGYHGYAGYPGAGQESMPLAADEDTEDTLLYYFGEDHPHGVQSHRYRQLGQSFDAGTTTCA